jgi:hypothetical protein
MFHKDMSWKSGWYFEGMLLRPMAAGEKPGSSGIVEGVKQLVG